MCKRLFVLFCLVILIVACQPAEEAEPVEMTDAQRHEIADTIKQAYQDYLDYDWKNNPDWYSKFFVEDNEVSWMGNPGIFVHGIRILPNRSAMEAVFNPMLENRTSTNMMVLKDFVSVISDTVAVYTFEGKYSITNLEGETGPDYPYTTSVVYLKKDDGWKMLHYHQSWSNTPIKEEKEETEN
ncbi:MAG: nuclear transport factor 2 family protein [Candidatus Aminicenantes bacterium]|nr:MAG: nuclear transport factor 2 family protein [Candidatus Aminicenantes bacterium]